MSPPEKQRGPAGNRSSQRNHQRAADGHQKPTGPTLADLGTADIDTFARVLGASYVGGAFPCPNRWCMVLDPVYRWPLGHTRSCYVQRPGMARCFACCTDFPYWELRAAVLRDGRLVRALAREIGAYA